MVGLNGAAIDRAALQRMTTAIVHRGPDDEGAYVDQWVGFGFRRLSILDLSPSGHQPMVSADGELVVVFNGEIYNYIELREELKQRGHRFRSTGDTEVLLAAYREWGVECLSRLNGMWAFTILDKRRHVLFGSRDRFGEKPLYYHRGHDRAFFASEIKSIVASGYYQTQVHWPSVAHLLFHNALDTSSETFYTGIQSLGAGTAFELNRHGEWRQWKYWRIDDGPRHDVNGSPAQAFSDLFTDAVRLRMRSDVPVGVCLSGGLDSTSIICAMAETRDGDTSAGSPLQAFCYQSPDFEETRYIQDTLAQTGSALNRLEVEPARLWDLLPTVLGYHDEPLHSPTALIGFELMRLAARGGVKVLLNGQGADETLAGYSRYFRTYWQTLAATGQLREAFRQIRDFTDVRGGSATSLWLQAIVDGTSRRLSGFRRVSRRRSTSTRVPWLTRDFHDAHNGLERNPAQETDLQSALKRSVEVKPLPLYLRIEDRNSMAHSVEARLPFLDPRLVSLAFSLPAAWKTRGPWNKFVLREAMRNRIPESVRTRVPKMGFPTSARAWFRAPWYEPLQDLLHSETFRSRGIFDVAAIQRDLARHRAGETDVSGSLFHVAQLEVWFTHVASEPGYRPELTAVTPRQADTSPLHSSGHLSPGPSEFAMSNGSQGGL
jgi:asparagine synthase (glutamine-hydrolysing)